MVKFERGFAVEIPGGEEESEEVSDGGPFEAKPGVFPVAVEGFLIDVFVGEIDAAGVADFAVDDDDFAVVAVIMEAIDAGIELVGWGAMDAKRFEIVIVAGRESEDAADVVIHDIDFDALLDFGLEDGEDLVPHLAGADDEKLEHDETLGGFEVEEELFEISFAAGEISGLVVFREGDVVSFADVVGLEGGGGVFGFEMVEGGVIGIERFELGAKLVGFEAKRLVFAIAGKKDEQKRSDDREAHDDEGPEQAHFEVLVVVDDVEGDGERKENGEDSDGEEVAIKEEIENNKNNKFGQDAEDSPGKTVGEEAFEDAEGMMRLMIRRCRAGGGLGGRCAAGGFRC